MQRSLCCRFYFLNLTCSQLPLSSYNLFCHTQRKSPISCLASSAWPYVDQTYNLADLDVLQDGLHFWNWCRILSIKSTIVFVGIAKITVVTCMSKTGGNTSSPVQLSGGSLAVWRDGNISGLAGKNDMIWWWFDIHEGEIGWHSSPAFVLIVKALNHDLLSPNPGAIQNFLWQIALTRCIWVDSLHVAQIMNPCTRDDGCWPNMFTIGTLASSAWCLGVLK